MSREYLTYRFPQRCCVCLAIVVIGQPRIAVSLVGAGAGEVVTINLYVPYCVNCSKKYASGGKIRLATAVIAGLSGALAGGLAKGASAAGGGALLGFVLGYFLVDAVFERVFNPIELDAKGRLKFKNTEYQALFDRDNPA